MSVKNWNYYYKENKETLTKEWLVDTIRLAFAVGLLWYSFFVILGEYFPSYVDVEDIVLLVYIVLLWVPENGRKLIGIAKVALPAVYIFYHFSKMKDGVLEIANDFLYRFNPYQGTNLAVLPGDPEAVPYVMTAILMILWMAIWGVASITKKLVYLVLFPAIAVLVVFLVGISPDESGIFCAFVAAFLLMVPKQTKIFRQVVTMILVILSINVASFFFHDEIDELATGKESITSWLENLELPEINLNNFLQLDFVVNVERVTNQKPNYSGEVVLALKTAVRPATSQYLKGFCATDYVNGTWKWDGSTFQQACESANYSEEMVGQIVSMGPFAVLSYSKTYEKLENVITVEYRQMTGDTVYVPYVFSHNSLHGNYTFLGDFLIKKDLLNKEFEVRTGKLGDLQDLSIYTYYAKLNPGYDTIRWYNGVAEKYTRRNDDLEVIDEAAAYIKGKVSKPTEENLWLSSQAIMYDELSMDTLLENMYRMELAWYVRGYLAGVMDYSLDLDRISSREDPIAYALTEGKEGYCMHYASAATLILKELGVPARYASGYIVRPWDYKLDSDIGKYVAEVEDYNSHAWVEIYLDNIGWVPVEVTEGYEDPNADLPTKYNPMESSETEASETESTETEATEELTETETLERPTEEPTEEPTEGPTEEPTESETESTEVSSSETQEEEKQPNGGNDNSDDQELWDNVFRASMVLILVFAVVYGCKMALVYYDYVLKREIDDGRTRAAVKRMHKRIARIMRLTNWKIGQITDACLEEILKKTYPQVTEEDWNRYMEIVKKMHYSKEQITHEEMMHVYWCYKNI